MRTLNEYFVYGQIADISTADEVYIAIPDGGDVVAIYSIIDGTIGTGDADLTAKIGTTAITGGLITVTASGSASGDIDVVYPTALNRVEKGGFIEIETDGVSTNTVKVTLTVVIRR